MTPQLQRILYAVRRATRDLSTHRSGNAVFFSMATLAPELAIDLSRRPGSDVGVKRAQYKTTILIEIIKHGAREPGPLRCAPRYIRNPAIFLSARDRANASRYLLQGRGSLRMRNKQHEVTLFIRDIRIAGEKIFCLIFFSSTPECLRFCSLDPGRGAALRYYNIERALFFLDYE